MIRALALLALLAQPLGAQGWTLNPGQVCDRQWRSPVSTVGDLPALGNQTGDVRAVLADQTLHTWDGAAWRQVSGGGGGGGTDDQTAAEVPIADAGGFFLGVQVEAALQEIGPALSDARPPTGAATGDLSGTYPAPSLADDVVGLAELAACAGPGEIVEYAAGGVPACIATPSGGGSPSAIVDGATSVTADDTTGEVRVDVEGERVLTLASDVTGPQLQLVGDDTESLQISVDAFGRTTFDTDNSAISENFYMERMGLRMLTVGTDYTLVHTGAGVERFRVSSAGANVVNVLSGNRQTLTLSAGATTFAVTTNFVALTGDGGGNTLANLTGGITGAVLRILFADANVTVTDDETHTAHTVDLSAPFTSSAGAVLTLIYDGTSWYETARSIN